MMDDKFIQTHTLLECLQAFGDATPGNTFHKREERLNEPFTLLAKKLLYGGYFEIRDKKGILLRTIKLQTIEFYYHCELEEGIKDYIVYHRNPDEVSKDPIILPALPLGSLHTHRSGIDITFEDQNNFPPQFRASALIRACQVIEHSGNLSNFFFDAYPIIESRSTYVYNAFFMGVNVLGKDNGLEIQWVDDSTVSLDDCELVCHHRQNVGMYNPEPLLHKDGYFYHAKLEPFKQDEREWAFTRSPLHVTKDFYTCPLCGGKVSNHSPMERICSKCGVKFINDKG